VNLTRYPRPVAALAVVALIGAGCGSTAPSESSTTGTNRDKAMKFSACMRDHGVKQFPDPDASGELTVDGVLNGSSLDPKSATWTTAIAACKDLQPAGFTGHKATPKEQTLRLKFAQCIREHGVKDFPDPAPGDPLVDTNHIPSSGSDGGMAILNAAMHKCRNVMGDLLGDRG
jgi:hypothetical protein